MKWSPVLRGWDYLILQSKGSAGRCQIVSSDCFSDSRFVERFTQKRLGEYGLDQWQIVIWESFGDYDQYYLKIYMAIVRDVHKHDYKQKLAK